MSLPKHLIKKTEKEWASYVGATHSEGVINGIESLWKILTEMSKDEEKAIEVESLAALSVDGPAIKRDIFYQGARFGLALGRVKFENIDTIVQNQTVAILEYDEHITELESKLAVAVEALEKTKSFDRHNIPCPDGIKGCAVQHGSLGKFGLMAFEALAKINGK